MDPEAVSRATLVTAALLALPASARWDAAGHGPALANFGSLRPADGSEAARDRALFLNAATWADLVRSRNQPWHVYHHATWHYADVYWDAENGRPHDIPNTHPYTDRLVTTARGETRSIASL